MASLASTMTLPSAGATVFRPSAKPAGAAGFRTTVGTVDGLRGVMPKFNNQTPAVTKSRGGLKSYRISCSAHAPPEILEIVQSTIAKQLSIDEGSVTPQTKFSDLGADSLDTVEIMMALEEKFGVSIGEGGAENIAIVQDAADLIEKVKTASA